MLRRTRSRRADTRAGDMSIGAAFRKQIVAETGDYLTLCLHRPELGVSIPAVPAETARFPRALADQFWDQVLFGR